MGNLMPPLQHFNHSRHCNVHNAIVSGMLTVFKVGKFFARNVHCHDAIRGHSAYKAIHEYYTVFQHLQT